MAATSQVLIVGAGPTGLVAGIALRCAGVDVRLVDKAPAPATTSRALGCQARSMEVLEALGVVDEVLAVSRPLRGSVSLDGARETSRLTWVPPDSPYPYTYVFAQSGLEEILRRRLAGLGTEIEWGCDVRALAQSEGGVTADTAAGRSLRAEWVIGCDGAHSAVRQAAAIPFEGRATGDVYYLADLFLDFPPGTDDLPRVWMHRAGPLMTMPLPTDPVLWRIFVDVTALERSGRLPPPSKELAQSLLDERGYGPGEVKVRGSVWESVYRVQVRQAAAYRRGRVFLAGDAAHVFPPFGGQGMNTGIQDADNLAWKLAAVISGAAAEPLLDTYHVERHHIGRQVVAEVEQRRRFFALRNPIGRALRDRLYRLLLRSKAVQRYLSLQQSQLAQSYRGLTWLSRQVRRAPGPRAGDRAPDGPYRGTRLFKRFSPVRFTLLVVTPTAGDTGTRDLPQGQLNTITIDPAVDPGGTLTRKYGAQRGALILVRPDGYIGFRGARDDWDALRGYLARLKGPGRAVASAPAP
jgi:4,5-epoxidase